MCSLAAGAVLASAVRGLAGRVLARSGVVLAGLATITVLGGPLAYAAQTDATARSGGGVTAGPADRDAGRARPADALRQSQPGARPPRGGGGFGEQPAPSAELVDLLRSSGTEWSAATLGSQGAASLELAGAGPVMAIGGFTGADPVPTLAQFRSDVSAGEVRWFVVSAGGPGRGRSGGTGAQISTWVQQHVAPTQVGGATVYDLRSPTT